MKKAGAILVLAVMMSWSVYGQSGVIREISGTVEIKNSGGGAFVTAKSGDTVRQDTVISTGFKSTALVEVGSTVIGVRPLTRLTLSEIRAGAGTETLNVNLQAGRVRVAVNPPAGTRASMTVSSPSATASVRGTSFDFDGQNVSVGDGIVDFRGSRGAIVAVPRNTMSGVSGGKAASPSYVRPGTMGPAGSGYGPPQGPAGADTSSGARAPGGAISQGSNQPAAPDPAPPSDDGNNGGTTPTPPIFPRPPVVTPPSEPTTGGIDVGITY